MDRLSFLKKFCIELVATFTVPKVIEEVTKPKESPVFNQELIEKRISEIRSSEKVFLKYWYPFFLPKQWTVCYSVKDITKKYRVIGLRKNRIFLSQFSDKWASLPFDMELKDFCNNFFYLMEVPIK